MKRNYPLRLAFLLLACIMLLVSGVMASWLYLGQPEELEENMSGNLSSFRYGTLYITEVGLSGGSYERAIPEKTADLNLTTDLTLHDAATSTVSISVTFYNNTDVSYFYNEAQSISHSNNAISYTVSGIEKKDEIPTKTFKTVTVTFAFAGSSTSVKNLLSEIHFSFVVDKDSIGDVVAQTALDRFLDILNNKAAPDSYNTLDTAMNNRGSLFNKASAVTYIGNVSGSSSSDSQTIKTLFGDEFMSMDLDGDGNSEPITMMIKRENLDGDLSTGTSYTYSSMGRETTVSGVEMTLYITAQSLSGVSSNQEITVYAAVFTRTAGATEWIQLTPLAKGTAKANNYNGYGSANSFNTDTWVSENGDTIETIVANTLRQQ